MNCLIVVPSLRRAGAETQAIDMANGLAKRGHRVHLFSFMPEKDQIDRLCSNVKFHYSERRTKLSYDYVVKLAKILDEESIDVVHSVMQFSGLIGWAATKLSKRKPPIVIAVHTTTNYDVVSEIADRLLYVPILKRVSTVVFVCKYQRDHWLEKYPVLSQRSVVVYNGIDTQHFDSYKFQKAGEDLRASLGIGGDQFVFACIAGFRPEKGHDLLIKAFAELQETAVLLLVGDGITRSSIAKTVQAAGLSKRVKFVGNLADVRPVIAASDATVLASTAVETFSMAMLESLAMATPMIAPRIGGLAEALEDGKSGLLFAVGDCDALAEAMEKFMMAPESAAAMGTTARETIKRNFELEQMLLRAEQVLIAAVDLAESRTID